MTIIYQKPNNFKTTIKQRFAQMNYSLKLTFQSRNIKIKYFNIKTSLYQNKLKTDDLINTTLIKTQLIQTKHFLQWTN